MNKKVVLFFSLIFISLKIFSNSGFSRYPDFLNAELLISAAQVLEDKSVSNIFVNPASQANKDRINFDFNFSMLAGNDLSSPSATYYGTGLNLGFAIPTIAGVVSFSTGYLGSKSTSFLIKDQGYLNLALSKSVYENLYMGLGIKTVLGTSVSDKAAEWMLGADLGFIHIPGEVGVVKDFKWGFSLQNLGWGSFQFNDNEKKIGSLSLFTPELGISFTAFKNDKVKIGFETGFELPSCLNIRGSVGMNLSVSDFFSFKISTTADYRELAGATPYQKSSFNSLIPSFGIIFNITGEPIFNSDKKFEKQKFNDFILRFGTGAMDNNSYTPSLWAISTGFTVPIGENPKFDGNINFECDDIDEVESKNSYSNLQYEKKSINVIQSSLSKKDKNVVIQAGDTKVQDNFDIKFYVSPNGDNIKDGIKWNFSKKDNKKITFFKLSVCDNDGNLVFLHQIDNSYDENRYKDFFKRLFLLKKEVTIPETIVWNCKLSNGEYVPDTIYWYQIITKDEFFNEFVSEKVPFVVSTKFPFADIKIKNSDNIFSPNDDKIKDTIIFLNSSSPENIWNITIFNDINEKIISKNFSGNLPSEFEWNGRDQNNVYVRDGKYRYYVSSINKAGSKFDPHVFHGSADP